MLPLESTIAQKHKSTCAFVLKCSSAQVLMPYPRTKFTRPIRRAIMIFLITLFCVLAPLIILYTAGYRYDYSAKKIKQTGVISIDVEPKNVRVYLNDVLIQKRIPIRLTNRAPGAYHLRIEADRRKTWEKDIMVESKQTTYIRDITLFQEALPIEIEAYAGQEINNVFFSHDGAYSLILKQKDNVYELSLFNTKTKITYPLTRTYDEYPPKVDWSYYSPVAMIETRENNISKIQIFNARNPEASADIHTIEAPEPINYQWSDDIAAPSVFAQEGNKILRLTMAGKSEIKNNIISNVWYIDNVNRLWIFDKKNQVLQIAGETSETRVYPVKNELTKIIHLNDKRLIAKSNQGVVILPLEKNNVNENKTIDAERIRYNPDTNEWLAWSPWELWTIYPNGNVELLNRTSDAIMSITPMDKFGVLLLAAEKTLRGFNPGYYITHELFSGGKINEAAADIENRQIYFWGEVGQRRGLFGLEY